MINIGILLQPVRHEPPTSISPPTIFPDHIANRTNLYPEETTVTVYSSFVKRIRLIGVSLLSILLLSGTAHADRVDTGFGEYRFPQYIQELTEAQEKYELHVPGFLAGTYGEFSPLRMEKPRYWLHDDGVYRSDNVPKDGVATIMLAGDLMCQGRQQEAAKTEDGSFDFTENFVHVAKMFSEADFVAGNLECTLSESASLMMQEPKVDDAIHCNAPSTYLDAVRYAGFDLLTTANNHCMDTGLQGLFQTIAHLDQYGFLHTGTFLRESDPRFVLAQIDGIQVAFLSYTTKFNGKNVNLTPEGQQIFLNEYSQERLAQDVAQAKSKGAEYIIAYNHWGREYVHEPTKSQYKWAQEMADAGVDYIIGAHPHALQPYDILTAADGRRVPVIYSIGNFVSHMTKIVSKEMVVIQIRLGRDENGHVVLLDEGAIPCRTFKYFKDDDYTTIPITYPYNAGLKSRYFGEAYEHITAVVGDKIPFLGTPAP